MVEKPDYFDVIKSQATKRWNQLEADPELAAPWHQLFKQVQSPRHVFSELLQNADDAGATEAFVSIDDEEFIFSHNGIDFTQENFSSLCKFGYSNKRALHTIGFRGIGFKSTFSLGDVVELYTPTLSVSFLKNRFTDPQWIDSSFSNGEGTKVRIKLKDKHVKKEAEKNLREWVQSYVSLLFFKTLRCIHIGEEEIRWGSLGPGPVEGTEWTALYGDENPVLIARSEEEPFPETALDEIRQERMLSTEEEMDFPPCRVELVLGVEGKLYVVLPTGVHTEIPFACNAPFIQDPARVKIKDPETSPTNRWLLRRIGKLAAQVMIRWLENNNLAIEDRVEAYQLFPEKTKEADTVEFTCRELIVSSFLKEIEREKVLLSENGTVEQKKECVSIEGSITDVWGAEQSAVLLDDLNRLPLATAVSEVNRKKLIEWDLLEEITVKDLIRVLKNKHLPKPESWYRLLQLWSLVVSEIQVSWYMNKKQIVDLRIFPVQGKEKLYSSGEIVRLGERKLLQSEEDWQFLENYLLVMNVNWTGYLADRRLESEKNNDSMSLEMIESAFRILSETGLDNTSDVNRVISNIAVKLFKQEQSSLSVHNCVRFAQIAAKLGAKVDENFKYVTRNGKLQSTNSSLMYDIDGSVSEILPAVWAHEHMLHEAYSLERIACNDRDWNSWVLSDKSGISTFPSMDLIYSDFNTKDSLLKALKAKGFTDSMHPPYVTTIFYIYDFDFKKLIWDHWYDLEKDNPNLWGELFLKIAAQPPVFWEGKLSCRVFQRSTSNTSKQINNSQVLPLWILKFRQLPCLPDTNGNYHRPYDLMRRTPSTEAFMGVASFIPHEIDTETNRPLLDALGVQDSPAGPETLLSYLRSFAAGEESPREEIEKWYRRLDQLYSYGSTEDQDSIREAFKSEKLILTMNGIWSDSSGVFQAANEGDVPGAEVILQSVNNLSLWGKIGVRDHPTADLVIEWLRGLPSGETLEDENVPRVKAMLKRHPTRVWNECGHWISLTGMWMPAESFTYSLSMQGLPKWQHLYDWVKETTADFMEMSMDILSEMPFIDVPRLNDKIENRLTNRVYVLKGALRRRKWSHVFGRELSRIELEDKDEEESIRELAFHFRDTGWSIVQELEVVPYIDGTPVGTPIQAEALWLDEVFYTRDLSESRLATAFIKEMRRFFRRQEIVEALKYCFERSEDFIIEYMEDNFKLRPPEEVEDYDGATGKKMIDDSQSESFDEPEDETQEGPLPEEEEPIEITETFERKRVIRHKPSIMERFALSRGFKKDGDTRFYHPNGSSIEKIHDTTFQWEHISSEGDVLRYYWAKDLCLSYDSLELPADVWAMLQRSTEVYALVLKNKRDYPIELSGTELMKLNEDGKITLYPASYRIAVTPDYDE